MRAVEIRLSRLGRVAGPRCFRFGWPIRAAAVGIAPSFCVNATRTCHGQRLQFNSMCTSTNSHKHSRSDASSGTAQFHAPCSNLRSCRSRPANLPGFPQWCVDVRRPHSLNMHHGSTRVPEAAQQSWRADGSSELGMVACGSQPGAKAFQMQTLLRGPW
jgi:hypothetical protein